ncbi:MAG: endonuclease III [Simkaniaceae bacterium]|nr:endonuclease III [Simkaniaceae bacterium]
MIAETLDLLFPNPSIPLYHRDPFTLLIAVLLSAQCTDIRVNEVTPLLFEKGGTPEGMRSLSIQEIQDIIRPCGLSSTKARFIHELSHLLLIKHNDQVPSSFEALEALPGVGHKTASVVMCQAFQKEAFPVDTHIHRLAKRWGLSDGSSVKKTEEDLKKYFPSSSWHKIHLQMIYYGRAYCPARGHLIHECPICQHLVS